MPRVRKLIILLESFICIENFYTFECMYVIAFIWSQEEPRNMGAWTFVKPRFENLAGRKVNSNSKFKINLII